MMFNKLVFVVEIWLIDGIVGNIVIMEIDYIVLCIK